MKMANEPLEMLILMYAREDHDFRMWWRGLAPHQKKKLATTKQRKEFAVRAANIHYQMIRSTRTSP